MPPPTLNSEEPVYVRIKGFACTFKGYPSSAQLVLLHQNPGQELRRVRSRKARTSPMHT